MFSGGLLAVSAIPNKYQETVGFKLQNVIMNIRRYVYNTIKPPPEQPKFVKTLIFSHKFCSKIPQTGGEYSERALLPLVLTIHHNNKDPLNAL